MKKILIAIFILGSVEVFPVTVAIRDVAALTNERDNYLVGYGLVVGLPGTGDSKNTLTSESLENLIRYTGINIGQHKYPTKNSAIVMVMSKIPAAASSGQPLDIWVSSIGDAKSLTGGYLLQTLLQGQNGQVYAVAQSNLPAKSKSQKSVKTDTATTVFVANGAVVEFPANQTFFNEQDKFRLSLRTFDVVNINAVYKSIEKKFPNAAKILPGGIIEVTVPEKLQRVDFLANILMLPVEIKYDNRVVIDAQSATIIMGNDVKISRVGLTKNGIVLKVQGKGSEKKDDSPVSNGIIEESASVEDLVKGLNTIGMSAEDIIDIIKAIDAAGALHGELIIL